MRTLDEKFHIPYSNRFEENSKEYSSMYGGKLQKVKFKDSGTDIDAILDRCNSTCIIRKKWHIYTISAEVFGKGIDMWLKSQGTMIEIID